MKKISSRKIAITSVFLALIAVFTFTPLGMFPIVPGVINAAFVILILITLAAQLEGLWVGVVCSTFFGLTSFVNSFINPTITAFIFQNPLVSILPRVAIGFTVFYSMKFFQKLFQNSKSSFAQRQLPSMLSAIVAIVTNTVLVLGFMAIGYGNEVVMLKGVATTILQFVTGTVLLVNFPIELAANAILVPILYSAVYKFGKKGV